jgi:FKBP-type peptidyl-prolyl cis-trans isomerase FkpA
MRFAYIPVAALLLAGCASNAPIADTAYAQKPATPFEQKFVDQGARPIKFGGWIRTITPGSGANPTPDSVVSVHYRGALEDGTEFDSSYGRGQPATFSLRNVVQCWTFGVPMMKAGEKAQLLCPAKVAYGQAGSPPAIPGNATLTFDIELLSIVK